jgi:hypothetical protein
VVPVERVLEGGSPRQIPDVVRFQEVIPKDLEVPRPWRRENTGVSTGVGKRLALIG